MSAKVIERPDGGLVLMCESGNPALGMIYTPETKGRLIVTMPGEDGHPLSAVSVTFAREQLDALAALIGRQRGGRRRPRTASPVSRSTDGRQAASERTTSR